MSEKTLSRLAPADYCCHRGACICGEEERGLRAVIAGRSTGALAPADRAWCLREIERVEGYERGAYEALPDADLARGVLDAWTDYCRAVALLLWHRFAPSHAVDFEEDSNRSE